MTGSQQWVGIVGKQTGQWPSSPELPTPALNCVALWHPKPVNHHTFHTVNCNSFPNLDKLIAFTWLYLVIY